MTTKLTVRDYPGFLLKWAILLFFLIVTLMPFLWLLVSSLKTSFEIETSGFTLPAVPQFVNYANALSVANLPVLFMNSILVAAFTVLLNLVVAALASFVFAREKFPGKDFLYVMLTAGVLIPIISFLVPYFILVNRIGLYNNLLALILVYSAVNIPVSIFLLTSFMKAIPKELEEAATIDGCNFIDRFWKVILPLAQSGLATAGTFCFIYAWNEFILAMLFTSSETTRTVQLGIRFFQSQFLTDYGPMFAAIMLSILPTVAVYVFMHNKIIAGLTSGGVKG
ncbi:MAG: carbohydrate ABC transporter permease [Spirochaetales bacterium]